MVIENVDIQSYEIPLRRPWRSARGVMHARLGWLVRVSSCGVEGFGDCAPLTDAGTEDAERAYGALTAWRARALDDRLEDLLDTIKNDPDGAPCATWAIDCALSDLAARVAGLPVRDWLGRGANSRVAVNAALGPVAAVTPDALVAAREAGHGVVKIKVGLGGWASELQQLRAIASLLPAGLSMRLDANGAWSYEDARSMIDGLAGLPVESLEEPLREPLFNLLSELQGRATFPLALDESLHAFIDRLPVERAVLKPAVIGGLRRTLTLARAMQGADRQVVLTSIIDTQAGLWPTIQLAALLPVGSVHGLATWDWLDGALGANPRIEDGAIPLDDRPGSGFEPLPSRV